MSDDVVVSYRPGLTVVEVAASYAASKKADGYVQKTHASDVTLKAVADPRLVWKVDFGQSSRHFDLKFAADGRLAGGTSESSGIGTQVLSAALRVGIIAAKAAAAGGVLEFRRVPTPPQRNDHGEWVIACEKGFEIDRPELGKRRRILRALVSDLDERLSILATEASKPHPRSELWTEIKAVADALASAEAQLGPSDTAFDEWLSERFPDDAVELKYQIPVDVLPKIPAALPVIRNPVGADHAISVKAAAAAAGIVVVLVDDTSQPSDGPVRAPEDSSTTIVFRQPRDVTLAVYEHVASDDPRAPDWHLRNFFPAWVVDMYSELAEIDVRGDRWGDESANIGFGPDGTLVHLASKKIGTLAAIVGGATGAGGAISDSIDAGEKLGGIFHRSDPATKALQSAVARAELQARLAEANKKIGSPKKITPV